MNTDKKLIEELRSMAEANKQATEIIQYLAEKLGCDNSRSIYLIKYLREALNFEISEAKMACAWNYFEGSTWSSDAINNELNPLILEKRWKANSVRNKLANHPKTGIISFVLFFLFLILIALNTFSDLMIILNKPIPKLPIIKFIASQTFFNFTPIISFLGTTLGIIGINTKCTKKSLSLIGLISNGIFTTLFLFALISNNVK